MSEGSSEQSPNGPNALEPNKTPKIIRVLTVCAYLICVSLAAIMLSIFYIFFWEPKRHDPSAPGTTGHGAGPVHRKH